jgi:hypothetical protein
MNLSATVSASSVDEFIDALANLPHALLGFVMNMPYERPIISIILLGFVIFLIRDLVTPFRKSTR